MRGRYRSGARRDGQSRRTSVGGTKRVEIVGADIATQDANLPGFADDGQVDIGARSEVVEDAC